MYAYYSDATTYIASVCHLLREERKQLERQKEFQRTHTLTPKRLLGARRHQASSLSPPLNNVSSNMVWNVEVRAVCCTTVLVMTAGLHRDTAVFFL